MVMRKNELRKLATFGMVAGVSALALSAVLASAATIRVDKTELGGGVPAANARAGSPENMLPPGFALNVIAQGSDPLENPSGVIAFFGYLDDFHGETNKIEASKTEPDINTY